MPKLRAEQPEIIALAYADLVHGLRNLKAGRQGRMSAGQVFKALFIKQMNGFSYQELAYHLEDSRTYRKFCGFGLGAATPSRIARQRDIKRIRPETLEKINRLLLQMAAERRRWSPDSNNACRSPVRSDPFGGCYRQRMSSPPAPIPRSCRIRPNRPFPRNSI